MLLSVSVRSRVAGFFKNLLGLTGDVLSESEGRTIGVGSVVVVDVSIAVHINKVGRVASIGRRQPPVIAAGATNDFAAYNPYSFIPLQSPFYHS